MRRMINSKFDGTDFSNLSANSFTFRMSASSIKARIGARDMNPVTWVPAFPHEDHRVRQIIIHKKYWRLKKEAHEARNNIALLYLATGVTWKKHIVPICLPDPKNSDFAEQLGTLTGWGETGTEIDDRYLLKKMEVKIFDFLYCGLSEHVLCSHSRQSGGNACEQDAGSPLAVRVDRRAVLAGIVSWHSGCNGPEQYTYYTPVANYLDWIYLIIRKYE